MAPGVGEVAVDQLAQLHLNLDQDRVRLEKKKLCIIGSAIDFMLSYEYIGVDWTQEGKDVTGQLAEYEGI